MLNFLKRRKRRTLIIGAAVLALAVAGGAFAIWNMSASTNRFEGRTSGTIALTFANPTAGDLTAATAGVPGGSMDLVAEVTNPSSAPIKIISWAPSASAGFAGTGACDASNFGGPAESTSQTVLATPITVAGGATNVPITLPAALTVNSNATSSCEAQTISETTGSLLVNFTTGT